MNLDKGAEKPRALYWQRRAAVIEYLNSNKNGGPRVEAAVWLVTIDPWLSGNLTRFAHLDLTSIRPKDKKT